MPINIKIRDNGPYLVEGEFTLSDAQGNPVEVKKAALCRCGGSTMKASAMTGWESVVFQVEDVPLED